MKIFGALLSLLVAASATAQQSEWYLKAGGGWGGTWMHSVSFTGSSTSDVARNAYHAALAGGWQRGYWSMEAGVGLSRTGGNNRHALLFEYSFDSSGNIIGGTPTEVTYTLLHRHYIIPVSVGYSIPLAERWALEPRLGAEGAYNAGAIDRSQIGADVSTRELSGQRYHSFYHRFALFGTAAVQVRHRVATRIDVFGGIGYRHALTNLLRVPAGWRAPASVRTASATVDAGVRFFLGRKAEGRSGISESMPEEG